MTTRFTTDSPLASDKTWAGRRAPVGRREIGNRFVENWRKHLDAEREAQIEAIWHDNMTRRDQAAKDYGEPETPHEFYSGRPGSQAEKIVCDCLRELRDIPEADRLYARELTSAISVVYLDLSWNGPWQRDAVKIHRRTMALMRIAAGEKE